MHTEHKSDMRNHLPHISIAVVLIALAITWYLHLSNQPSSELQNLADSTTQALNEEDYERLEQLLGNSSAVDTLRHDFGDKQVHLGQIQESDSETSYFTIVSSDTPKTEVFVYVTRDESGSWQANVP